MGYSGYRILNDSMTTKKGGASSRKAALANLEAWRKRQGITLEQVMERTKIGRPYLQAIEAGDFRGLPGGIFTLSWLRQYAEVVGLDPDDLVRDYRAKTDVRPPGPASVESRGLLGRLFRVPA